VDSRPHLVQRAFAAPLDDLETAVAEHTEWFNHDHRHSANGVHTPSNVHHGHAGAVREARTHTLSAAYAATPEVSSHRQPGPPTCQGPPESTDQRKQTEQPDQQTRLNQVDRFRSASRRWALTHPQSARRYWRTTSAAIGRAGLSRRPHHVGFVESNTSHRIKYTRDHDFAAAVTVDG
jgi:hypothetical protein